MLLKEKRSDFLNTALQFLRNNERKVLAYTAVCILVVTLIGGYLYAVGGLKPVFDSVTKKLYEATGFHLYNDFIVYVRNLDNYIGGLRSNPEKIAIDIQFVDFQRLAYARERALTTGLFEFGEEDYVPAQIHHKNQTVDVRLRLKGDAADHLGEKWSFRINVRGNNSLFGMDEFSIQAPETRNNLYEWIFHEAIKREDIISLRYDFIDVTINGEHKGIYALEEHFDKVLIEHNNRLEGPILKFNEDLVWADRAQDLTFPPTYFTGLQSELSSNIDVFNKNTILADSRLYDQFLEGKDLLESFRTGNLPAHQVFDVNKMAKYIAIADLMGAPHALYWNNLRFYYNPVTSLLEPIGFDADAGEQISKLTGTGKPIGLDSEKPLDSNNLIEKMFWDPAFFSVYNQELERISQDAYLDDLFSEITDALQEKTRILHKDYVDYYFSKDILYNNRNVIRKALNPAKGLFAHFNRKTPDGRIILEVGVIQSMPLEILSVSLNDSELFTPARQLILLNAKSSGTVQYENVEFVLPEGFEWSEQHIADLRLNYRILGTSRLRNESIFPWSHLSENFPTTDFMRQEPNVNEFDFLLVDDNTERIVVERGGWALNRNLIVPAGYVFVMSEGTRLDLRNDAKILSYSPLQLLGTKDSPVIIESTDSTGQGILVLNADSQSELSHAIFQDLSVPSQQRWELTGAVTFYESSVKIDYCRFASNKTGDDLLHIIRSEFEITNSVFEDALNDALDVDFGRGRITLTSFVDSGNDAMDFSGSIVDVVESSITGSGDKGISAGEKSHVGVDQGRFEDCYVAVASKDISEVTVQNSVVSNTSFGFAAYQKKAEFGPSDIVISSVELVDVATLYLVEDDSFVTVDGDIIDDNWEGVFGILYGE